MGRNGKRKGRDRGGDKTEICLFVFCSHILFCATEEPAPFDAGISIFKSNRLRYIEALLAQQFCVHGAYVQLQGQPLDWSRSTWGARLLSNVACLRLPHVTYPSPLVSQCNTQSTD